MGSALLTSRLLIMCLSSSRSALASLNDDVAGTLDEPIVNRLQEGTGLKVFALVVPILGEAGGGAQLPPTGLLLLSNRQRLMQVGLRFTLSPSVKSVLPRRR